MVEFSFNVRLFFIDLVEAKSQPHFHAYRTNTPHINDLYKTVNLGNLTYKNKGTVFAQNLCLLAVPETWQKFIAHPF